MGVWEHKILTIAHKPLKASSFSMSSRILSQVKQLADAQVKEHIDAKMDKLISQDM